MEDTSIMQFNDTQIGMNVERRNSIQQVGYTTSLSSWLEQIESQIHPILAMRRREACRMRPRGRGDDQGSFGTCIPS